MSLSLANHVEEKVGENFPTDRELILAEADEIELGYRRGVELSQCRSQASSYLEYSRVSDVFEFVCLYRRSSSRAPTSCI
jgi:hypothetical protein